MDYFVSMVDAETLARERNKARELRAGQWWRNRLAVGVCHYCGCQVAPADLTMDHKVPLVRGGRSNRNNIVACCKECNNEKKHLLLGEWIAKRHEEGRPLACAKSELD